MPSILPLYRSQNPLKLAVVLDHTKSIEQAPTSCKPGLKATALSAIALVGAGIYCASRYFGDSNATALSKVAQDGLDISHRLVSERAAPIAIPLSNQVAVVGSLFRVNQTFFTDADGGFVQPTITQGPSWLSIQLNPIVTAYYAPSDYAHSDSYACEEVQVIGNTAYVAYGNSGLQIINIATPSNPTLIGIYTTPRFTNGVQVVGTTAYVAAWDSLQIINIATPSNPTLIGRYETPGVAFKVQVIGNTAYMAGLDAGLLIINITTPSHPTLIGNYTTPGRAWHVQVVGNIAYVADEYSGLQIINVATPSSPTLIGTFRTTTIAYGIQVVGTTAYVAAWDSLQIINITTPSSPTLIGAYKIGSAFKVEVVGNIAYVANQFIGLQLIDIAKPSSPTLIGTYKTLGFARGVQVVGTTVYLADGDHGLQILQLYLNSITLLGTPSTFDQGNYIVTLMGTTTQGTATTSFNLKVTSLAAPVYQNPISTQQATVDINYNYVMPDNVFIDSNGNAIIYRVKDLPQWLKFNANSRTLSGKPTPGDTNTYADKSTLVTIIASNGIFETAGQFTVTVSGDSYLAKIIKIGGPTLSVLGAVYSGYKNRALLLNLIAKRKWRNNQISLKLGEIFMYELKTDIKDIRKVQTYVRDRGALGKITEKIFCGRERHVELASRFPLWIQYDPDLNTLYSTRELQATDFRVHRKLQIRVLGGGGVIKELLKLELDGGPEILESGIDPLARQERIGLLLSPPGGTNFIEMDGIGSSQNEQNLMSVEEVRV